MKKPPTPTVTGQQLLEDKIYSELNNSHRSKRSNSLVDKSEDDHSLKKTKFEPAVSTCGRRQKIKQRRMPSFAQKPYTGKYHGVDSYSRTLASENQNVVAQGLAHIATQEQHEGVHPYQPAYVDVVGQLPIDHPNICEVEMFDSHPANLEIEKGKALADRGVLDAPPYWMDLPWEDMNDISVEEFIIIFPNHIMRWPGLALALRVERWDQLFHRTATLINLARGSLYWLPEQQHVRALPIMFKVEAAIQEFEPRYTLAKHDYWAPQIGKEWLLSVFHQKPRKLLARPEPHPMADLKEAASNVQFNPFANRPFSQRLAKYLGEYQQWELNKNTTNTMMRQVLGMGEQVPMEPTMRSPTPVIQESSAMEQREKRTSRADRIRQRQRNDVSMIDFGELADNEDNGEYEELAPIDGRRLQDPQCKLRKGGLSGPVREKINDRKRQHNPHPKDLRPESSDIACRNGQGCTRPHCQYNHFPREGTNTQARQGLQNARQQQNWRLQLQNGQEMERPYTKRCSNNLVCTRANCYFAHQSTAAPENIEIWLDQRCRSGSNCSNRKCKRSHPSPVSRNDFQGGSGQALDRRNQDPGSGRNHNKTRDDGRSNISGHNSEKGNGDYQNRRKHGQSKHRGNKQSNHKHNIHDNRGSHDRILEDDML
jgi:hypothetical protein